MMVNNMRENILNLLEKSFDAMDLMTIADKLNITTPDEIENLKFELDVLVNDLTVYLTKKDKYILYTKCPNFRKGKIDLNRAGNGFVVLDPEDDLFVPRESLNYALDGDFVLVEILTGENGKKEGRVIKILERDLKNIVGIIKTKNSELYFEPIKKDLNINLTIDALSLKSCVDGEIVVATLTDDLGKNRYIAEISQHICHKDDAKEDILTIAAKYEIYDKFPEEALKQAEELPNEVTEDSLESELKKRVDLRNKIIFTIDGADTKDIDDAISLEIKDGIYNLIVSIADVSYYVTEGSPLDQEALRRGTSSYLADAVLPMLPHKLSNGICSLNPGVIRYALSCDMKIDSRGHVVDSNIYPSVIKSSKKMTYTDVNSILNDDVIPEGYENFADNLKKMQELAHVIRAERNERGGSNFETVEAKIVCDEDGKAIDIVRRIQDEGEKMIEDFMVIANETVSSTLERMELPCVYRVHDIPKPERIQSFLTFLNSAGYHIVGKFNNITRPKMFQRLLDQISEQGDEAGIINAFAVRAMNKAFYSPENIGHFGLASRAYSHFTSPIRRYPDLMLHRLIRTFLIDGHMDNTTIDYYNSNLPAICEQASVREVAAVECEREVVKVKSAEYMESHIGEEYDAFVSGVLKRGFFVQTANLVEGLVSVDTLKGDYFVFDEERQALVGENSKKSFTIGTKVRVKCIGANKALGEVDFELLNVEFKSKRKDEDKKKNKRHKK